MTATVMGHALTKMTTFRVRRRGYWTRIVADDPKYPLAGTELEIAAACWRYGIEGVRERWDEMPRLTLYKIWRFVSPFPVGAHPVARWLFAIGWLSAAPFVVMGLLPVYRSAPPLAWMLLIPLAATLAAVLVVRAATRFRDGLAPCFLIFAAHALVERAQRLGDRLPAASR